jgi:formamidopyrimidine-DNA glycosylase
MPELPEVETVARDLRGLVVGARIAGSRNLWQRTLRSQDPAAFDAAVAGRTIVATGRRAKLVVLDLDDASAITIHLKMTGQLFVVSADLPDDPYLRHAILFEDGRELRFRDIRKFGRIGIARRDGVDGDLRGELGGERDRKGFGPEPLEDAFTVRRFRRAIRARKGRLKPLLLDQGFLAGVGNIYADEALWAARMHYARPTKTMSRAQAVGVITAATAVMGNALHYGGTSFDALYVNINGSSGYFDRSLAVYGREGEPCPRCGTPIRREPFMNRSSYRCPRCQRAPRGFVMKHAVREQLQEGGY